ncbi:hypothetical protein ACXYMO_04740 [Arenibacterium sp. CAU 1754]
MEVIQVINLAAWCADVFPDVLNAYNALKNRLDHNAQQPQKKPLREELDGLTHRLARMRFDTLTNEEIDLLDDLGALSYLGQNGLTFVNQTIRTSDFDPASASSDIGQAAQKLHETLSKIGQAQESLNALGLDDVENDLVMLASPLVRVRFKDEASIDDVQLLKKWTSDWYDIARGAAMCVGETPQAVRVAGASNGSIIVTLTTIASVSVVLAIIAKNAGRVAREVLSIANDIEDFRHKRRLNDVIETELKKQQNDVQNAAVTDTMNEVKTYLSNAVSNEVENALKKSVQKYFDFYQKGGDVDFIAPREDPDEENENTEPGEDLDTISALAEENGRLVQIVKEVRAQQAEILRLTHHADEDWEED